MRDPDRFDAWLNRLVVRACYQELRRAKRGPIQIQIDSLHGPGTEIADNPDVAAAYLGGH